MSKGRVWIVGGLALVAGALSVAPVDAQRRGDGYYGTRSGDRIGRDALTGGVVFGPGGVEVWVRTGRPDVRRPPPRRGARRGGYVDRDVRRAWERYDRDVHKARQKYERDIHKAEDRYYRRGDGRRYERDIHKAEDRYREAIYKAEHRLEERLARAHRRGYPRYR